MKKNKKSGFIGEFKAFALRGSVIDLAVGVIIGGAFSTITSSLVQDIIMPVVGMFIGGIDFSTLNLKLPSIFPGRPQIELNLGNLSIP
jgi:large conductance mechanosensitive channel